MWHTNRSFTALSGLALSYLSSCLLPREHHLSDGDSSFTRVRGMRGLLELGWAQWSPAKNSFQVTSDQIRSVAQSCPTLCDPMNRSTPGLPIHHQLPEFTSIESVMPPSHLILCCPLLLLPPIPPSIRVFSKQSALTIRWPKYWDSPSTSVLPMNI